MRIWGFIREALPIVIGAIFIVNLLYYFKVFEQIALNTAPVITWLWGLPEEAIVPLLIGILRKDVAIGMFGPLELTTHQLITGSVILAMFFPCIATFVVLIRELKFWDGLKAIGIMLFTVLIVGTAVNLLLP
jgi:ferrous iron transport protein B